MRNNTSTKPDEELRRNPLTVRWSDHEHKLVTDTAWRNRISASEFIRRLVMEGIGDVAAAD